MPILNYTTSVDADKTATEVVTILAKAGARSVGAGIAQLDQVMFPYMLSDSGRIAYAVYAEAQPALPAGGDSSPPRICPVHKAPLLSRGLDFDSCEECGATIEAVEFDDADLKPLTYGQFSAVRSTQHAAETALENARRERRGDRP